MGDMVYLDGFLRSYSGDHRHGRSVCVAPTCTAHHHPPCAASGLSLRHVGHRNRVSQGTSVPTGQHFGSQCLGSSAKAEIFRDHRNTRDARYETEHILEGQSVGRFSPTIFPIMLCKRKAQTPAMCFLKASKL